MIYYLEVDFRGILFLFDILYVIKIEFNYFKNILVGGGYCFVDVEVLVFFERGITKD